MTQESGGSRRARRGGRWRRPAQGIGDTWALMSAGTSCWGSAPAPRRSNRPGRDQHDRGPASPARNAQRIRQVKAVVSPHHTSSGGKRPASLAFAMTLCSKGSGPIRGRRSRGGGLARGVASSG